MELSPEVWRDKTGECPLRKGSYCFFPWGRKMSRQGFFSALRSCHCTTKRFAGRGYGLKPFSAPMLELSGLMRCCVGDPQNPEPKHLRICKISYRQSDPHVTGCCVMLCPPGGIWHMWGGKTNGVREWGRDHGAASELGIRHEEARSLHSSSLSAGGCDGPPTVIFLC